MASTTFEATRTPDVVRDSFLTLAARFRPADAAGLHATWVVELDGAEPHTITVRGGNCSIAPGRAEHPNATIGTDTATWLAIVDGSADGLHAFMAGNLRVDGDLNLAMRLETVFRPGPFSTRVPRTMHTSVRGVTIESFVAGAGTPVLLLHGLCASKVSFLPTLDALSRGYEVHALDLPGFGKSERPLPAGRRYTPGWYADMVQGYLRRHNIRQAYIVGNSMGGRIGTELAIRHPKSVLGVVGLGPAVAFDEWKRVAPLLKLLRTQWLGLAPALPLRQSWVEGAIAEMFHDVRTLPQDNLRAAAAEFLSDFRDRRFRMAVLACARALATDPTAGRDGYWARLAEMRTPSLWIWGTADNLVSCRYATKVRQVLPTAQVEVWTGVGHVPQFEAPERTNTAIRGFLDGLEARRGMARVATLD